MARGVDDVDAHILPHDRGRLGQNGDAALLFQIVGIHDAFDDALVVAERAGLLQEAVDKSGLAVIDVRDDRDIAELHLGLLAGATRHLTSGMAQSCPVLMTDARQTR